MATAFKISEDIISIPPKKGGRGRPIIYPFAQMEVGQHFDAPRDLGKYGPHNGDRRQANVARSAIQYAKRHNPAAKFTTRLIDKDTVRCWRVA